MPSVATLSPLSVGDLRRILTDVRGSLASQYTALFGYSGIEIRFTTQALDEICRKASEKGGGARGLRAIMVCPLPFICLPIDLSVL
jgi:ATP-dependent Clp protease ATP-binding subunit ClpX